MDYSEEYINMSVESDIQNTYKPAVGDFAVRACEYDLYIIGLVSWKYDAQLVWMTMDGHDGITLKHDDSQKHYLEKLLWIPRQDQLQNMVFNFVQSKLGACRTKLMKLFAEFLPYVSENGTDYDSFEKLWLAFIEKELYNKYWDSTIKLWRIIEPVNKDNK